MTLASDKLRSFVIHFGEAHNIKPELIAAIVMAESNAETYAMRYEPQYPYLYNVTSFAKRLNCSVSTERMGQSTSWGLMQIMGASARELGFFGHFPELCDPATNLFFGAKHLGGLLDKHKDLRDAVSAYNAGSPRRRPDGTYFNQGYVDRVVTFMETLSTSKLLHEGH